MLPTTIEQIAEIAGGQLIDGGCDTSCVITSVVRDNREVVDGSLFLCFKGERVDGHDYANAAFKSGAVCAIAERELEADGGAYILVDSTAAALRRLGAYYRARFDIPIIGITGSVGKTTAKEMIAAVLSERFITLKTEANLNNEIGVPLTLLKIGEEHEAAVIEMGISDFGEMTRLAEMVRPDICVMTSIGHSHLEQLGDLDGVLRAKSEVFPHMPVGGVAIVNGDDERLFALKPGMEKLTFGLDEHNDYRAENVLPQGTNGVSFDVAGGLQLHAGIPAFGEHLALAALAAAAVARRLGMTGDEIAAGLRNYRPVGSRAGVIETGFITIIDDCYNANPHSMAAALRSIAALPGRRVALLGDMKELGAKSNELHREIGVLAGKLGIDCLICCGEKAEFIFKGYIASRFEGEPYHFPFKEILFERLPGLIKKDDTVLVKASHSMKFEEFVPELEGLNT